MLDSSPAAQPKLKRRQLLPAPLRVIVKRRISVAYDPQRVSHRRNIPPAQHHIHLIFSKSRVNPVADAAQAQYRSVL